MKVITIPLGCLLCMLLLIAACGAKDASSPQVGASIPANVSGPAGLPDAYDFENPQASFALPDELQEISGLAMLGENLLGAVQDEEGIFFVLNAETGAVESRHEFGDPDDYEGVELVGDRVFVLKSNGSLVEIAQSGQASATEHETSLKGKNDTEGLTYDAANNRLLIACKEDPGNDLGKDIRAIYAFDLQTNSLIEEPAFVIDTNELDLRGKDKFKPSALAIHPNTGEVFVLSSTAHTLLALDQGGVRQSWSLSKDLFEQPEGLAFMQDGTLFISSEGVDGPGMVFRFDAAARE